MMGIIYSLALMGIVCIPYNIPEELITDWQSKYELVQFLQSDNTSNSAWVFQTFDCDDFAYQLRDRALAQHRYLSIQIIFFNDYSRLFNIQVEPNSYDYHVINMARVGNDIYFIEPQSDVTIQLPGLD